MKIYRSIPFLFLMVLFSGAAIQAQPIDGISAVVGEDIILRSDIENQYNYYIANGEKDDGTMRCALLENLLISKLLLNKAKQDSLMVSEDQVEGEVQRRIMMFSQQLGGEKELEEAYKKSILEIKQDLRPEISDQMLVDQQRNKVLGSIIVTPREVKEFFKSIPKDSLPFLPAEVELHHLVINPPFSESSLGAAREKLEMIRQEIVENGKDFATMARISSMGPSSKDGGSLGEFGRGQMVPEFDDIIFNLREDEVSQVFQTTFGFHVAKLHKRLGERVRASHILIIPERTEEDDQLATDRLNEIRSWVMADTVTFEKMAIKYSQDQATKDCGGCIKNPQTGETRIPLDMLDADLFFKVDNMEEGQISEPMQLIQPNSTDKLFHILFLKRRIPPHLANLKDDYQKLQNAALQAKQAVELEKWFKSAKKNIFIEIMDEACLSALKNWE